MTVRLGAIIPNTGGLPDRPGLMVMARFAEEAGAQGLWVNDHVVTVANASSPYPYTADGTVDFPMDLAHFECLTSCAFLAAATQRCMVGTAALVLPQRNLLELAKTTATLDRLSGGRLILGVGLGWLEEEMHALGYDFVTRGARADEMITALRDCWTGRPQRVDGEEVHIPDGVIVEPRPLSPRGPQLLVGGMSRAALRRVALRGDGWLAVARAHEFDVDRLASRLRQLDELAGGRSLRRVLKLHSGPEVTRDVPALAVAAGRLGFDEVIIEPPWQDVDEAQRLIAETRVVLQRGRSGAAAVAQP